MVTRGNSSSGEKLDTQRTVSRYPCCQQDDYGEDRYRSITDRRFGYESHVFALYLLSPMYWHFTGGEVPMVVGTYSVVSAHRR